jgi:hypothetical protein
MNCTGSENIAKVMQMKIGSGRKRILGKRNLIGIIVLLISLLTQKM